MFEERFMRRAIQLSIEGMSSDIGGPFGCVIVKDGKIIGEGTNEVTSSNNPTRHAEIVAIIHACAELGSFLLTDCEIYTSCYPCPMCFGAIYWSRPAVVYYANTAEDAAAIKFDDAHIYRELELPDDQRCIQFSQHMRTEALVAFEDWKSKADKKPY